MGKKKEVQGPPVYTQIIVLLTNVVHKIGIPGAIIVIFLYIIICKSSAAQQQEIIDKWVLFKNNDQCQVFAITVVIFALIVYGIEGYIFKRIRKLDLAEIKRLQKKVK